MLQNSSHNLTPCNIQPTLKQYVTESHTRITTIQRSAEMINLFYLAHAYRKMYRLFQKATMNKVTHTINNHFISKKLYLRT
jgi:hypothetical protein